MDFVVTTHSNARFLLKGRLVTSLQQVTGYSLGVNGKNQVKLKEKSRVHHGEEDVLRGEDVFHDKAYCLAR